MIQKELPDFPFPSFVEERELLENELRYKLPLSLFLRHEKYTIKRDNREYFLEIENPNDVLKLIISTLKGYCPYAKHFYGKIILPKISFVHHNKGRLQIIEKLGVPDMLHTVDLLRILKTWELSTPRFEKYNEGDLTRSFNSIDEVANHSRIVVEKFFPGFRLKIEEDF